jgi:uncharacterized protein YbaP (TraB family)
MGRRLRRPLARVTRFFPICRSVAAGLALALLAVSAHADVASNPLWLIKGKHNSVYLLGSIHVLRASDYPLSKAITSAYADAEVLYMEIDLDDIDEDAAHAFTLSHGLLPAEQSLRQVLGANDFADADERARALGVDLELYARFEPWVAALAVVQAQIAGLGLDPQHGVEQHLLRRATSDKKPVRGLETLTDQLGVFDALTLDRQSRFLLMSLEDAVGVSDEVDDMIAAWRRGDSERLAETLSDEFAPFPDLYAPLIVTRNRNWAAQIVELLDDEDDYLIVVGALHLVGKDSVIELLRSRAIPARQL